MVKVGDHVEYTGVYTKNLRGRKGIVIEASDQDSIIVQDDDPSYSGEKWPGVYASNVTVIPAATVSVDQVVSDLLNVTQNNPKDTAVRQLGVASSLVRLGEAAKKKAKEALIGFGIIDTTERKPGTERIYDSKSFVIDAVTSEPREYLDEAALRKSLKNTTLTQTVINRVVRDARVKAKTATSYKVTEK